MPKAASKYQFDYTHHVDAVVPLLLAIENAVPLTPLKLSKLVHSHPQANETLFSKTQLVEAYRQLAGTHGLAPFNQQIVRQLQMKPMRTLSGVAPVTVLTKPFPCPGKCIFCPNDIRMPKSYLSDEPGAQRAERNYFDPYLQMHNRLSALVAMGHTVDKVELIVLGGTWSFYPEKYQIWFIRECFRALNEFGVTDDAERIRKHYDAIHERLRANNHSVLTNEPSVNAVDLAAHAIHGDDLQQRYNQVVSNLYIGPEKKLGLDLLQSSTWEELESEQKKNETSATRCVGLVLETRPDEISVAEVVRLRRLGCTKTQIGVQSLQDAVLDANHRGHTVAQTREAFALVRRAGFKIHAHWMANLLGSSTQADCADYDQLFTHQDFRPDELKIYPCSLIESAELLAYHKRGEWLPYSHDELLSVVSHCLQSTPEYCRLTRVIRDIPSTDIVVGNKMTNFRQLAEAAVLHRGGKLRDIRAQEIRDQKYDTEKIHFSILKYTTSVAQEQFLRFQVPVASARGETQEGLLAFLRLSLPTAEPLIEELTHTAMIREIHVYGRATALGDSTKGVAQHTGLGKQLLAHAKTIAAEAGYKQLAVISAVGTREYYRKLGFSDGKLYQYITL